MSKTYHPAIRNGKPVLVSKTEKIDKSRIMDEAYFESRISELKGYQIVEVSFELVINKQYLWHDYKEMGWFKKAEGYVGKEILVEGVDFKTIPTAVFIKGHYSNTCVSCKKLFFYTAKRWLLCKSCCEKPIAVPIQAQQDLSGDLTYSLVLLLSQACKQLEKHEIDSGLVEECKEFMGKYRQLIHNKNQVK